MGGNKTCLINLNSWRVFFPLPPAGPLVPPAGRRTAEMHQRPHRPREEAAEKETKRQTILAEDRGAAAAQVEGHGCLGTRDRQTREQCIMREPTKMDHLHFNTWPHPSESSPHQPVTHWTQQCSQPAGQLHTSFPTPLTRISRVPAHIRTSLGHRPTHNIISYSPLFSLSSCCCYLASPAALFSHPANGLCPWQVASQGGPSAPDHLREIRAHQKLPNPFGNNAITVDDQGENLASEM